MTVCTGTSCVLLFQSWILNTFRWMIKKVEMLLDVIWNTNTQRDISIITNYLLCCLFSSDRKTVAHGGAVVPHPFGISLFEHNVYFTDWTKMAVIKANKFTDSNPHVIYTTSHTPHGVAVIHQLKQPQGKLSSSWNPRSPLQLLADGHLSELCLIFNFIALFIKF